ncbi:MAG: chemotaxis protein CheW [bacterium]|nr:MAG: chemotaxis protein CheW [bacterium]
MDLVEIRKKAKKERGGKKAEKAKTGARAKPKAKRKEKRPDGEVRGMDDTRKTEPIEEVKPPADVVSPGQDPEPPPSPVVKGKPDRIHQDELASLKDVLRSQHADEREEEDEEHIQILTFMLAGEEYGLNIMEIKEIVRPKEPTEVPRTPDFVLGIISLRGMIIPIYDVRARLGLKGGEQDQRSRVIVVKHREHFYGLLVDSVVQVMDIPLGKIEPPPEIVSGVEGEFLRGIGKIDDRLIILLNLSRILSVEDVVPPVERDALVSSTEPAGDE